MLTGGLLLGAVLAGSVVGTVLPSVGTGAAAAVSPLIFALVLSLLCGIRGTSPRVLRRSPRVVLVALALNFLVVPVLSFGICSTLMTPGSALWIGALLYCLFPCTDWFLAFTRLADGDVRTGAALIPLNMALQLALFPVYAALLTGDAASAPGSGDWLGLVRWFVVPALLAGVLRATVAALSGRRGTAVVLRASDLLVPAILACLVAALFASNVGVILEHPADFVRILAVVLCFLLAMYVVGELAALRARLPYDARALLAMTTSARNAPLILALAVVALPGRPMVYAALVLGMLVEFPHLTALQALLRRSRAGLEERPLGRLATLEGAR